MSNIDKPSYEPPESGAEKEQADTASEIVGVVSKLMDGAVPSDVDLAHRTHAIREGFSLSTGTSLDGRPLFTIEQRGDKVDSSFPPVYNVVSAAEGNPGIVANRLGEEIKNPGEEERLLAELEAAVDAPGTVVWQAVDALSAEHQGEFNEVRHAGGFRKTLLVGDVQYEVDTSSVSVRYTLKVPSGEFILDGYGGELRHAGDRAERVTDVELAKQIASEIRQAQSE